MHDIARLGTEIFVLWIYLERSAEGTCSAISKELKPIVLGFEQ